MTEERVGNPDARTIDKLVERGLRRIVPFTRWLALTSDDVGSWRWRLHIKVSNAWCRAGERITVGIWN